MFMSLSIFRAKDLKNIRATAKNIGWLNMITGAWTDLWQSGHLENIKLYNFYD